YVYCVGMNYAAHARELGNEPPAEPVIFLKSNSCLVRSGGEFMMPEADSVVHYEGELVVMIKEDCGRLNKDIAEKMILGYAVGIDYTLREVQNQAKKDGLPWTLSKSFYGSAPLSEFVLKDDAGALSQKSIQTLVNGKVCQDSSMSRMIFSVPELISFLSHRVPLKRGDIIFTGTPEGVGPVQPGDEVICRVDGAGEVLSHVI
ncbi:MAG: fumarylacetoacetate hydrolase family protein, partial [Spirochaetota bacterium]|nr:fumarylacetoacetate hydrolase family protein [Spirochaetota bacterium]